jgi:hypothetical protein
LIHQITSITWEVCGSPKLAQLRENELLRLHKPKFNVANTRPEHYGFLGLKTQGQRLVLRSAKSPEAEPMETLWGAFKGSVRVAYTALSRLLWTIASQSTSPYDILSVLVHGRLPERFVVELSPATLEPVCNALASFLSGESDGFLDLVGASLPGRQGVCPFLIRLWDHDMECLREFYQLGPQRNRELRWRFDLAKGVIDQAELDDLLVICRQEARLRSTASPQPPSPLSSNQISGQCPDKSRARFLTGQGLPSSYASPELLGDPRPGHFSQ